jgi:glycosyltransferase involved in cell wall biosynthesis
VGRYVDGIVDALVDSGTDVIVACQPGDLSFFESRGVAAVAGPSGIRRAPFRLLWEQIGLPRLARKLMVDVVHSPHYTFPLLLGMPRVVTVHDLTFFTLPGLHSPLKRVFFRWWIRAASRLRITVIADSQATATDFVRIAGASPERITVSHLGYDEELFHSPDAASVERLRAAIPDLPDSWIAFLGTLEPRKNIVALIDGYRAATKDTTSPAPALLLAGGTGWDQGVDPAIAAARAEGADVRKVGYLPLETLSAFLGGSIVFAYPSLGEGFGLPVLEAMAAGACVMTTDRLSLPEVGGDAVAYTGVSSAEIATSLSALLADPQRRSSLSVAALDRARAFTWASAAIRHTAAYSKAVKHG